MVSEKTKTTEWALGSVDLQDVHTYSCGPFIKWLESQGATRPDELSARHVRSYLAQLAGRGNSDRTIFDRASAIRAMVRFWHAENYIPQLIRVEHAGGKN